MTRFLGVYIGAGFGLAFVLINAGPPLAPALSLALRVLAVAALVGVVALTLVLARRPDAESGEGTAPDTAPRMRFGPFYGAVVAVEAVLIFGGIRLLGAAEVPMEANVAWIALVVGLHFLPLAWYWRTRQILGVALYLTALGTVGLVMVLTGHPAWAPFVSGVLSGVGMLGGLLVSLAAAYRTTRDDAAPAGTP